MIPPIHSWSDVAAYFGSLGPDDIRNAFLGLSTIATVLLLAVLFVIALRATRSRP